jgi:hypothetical protein
VSDKQTPISRLLRDADPVRDEPELSAIDAQVMRRVVVSAAGSAPPRAAWQPAVWVAAAVALAIAVGLGAGRWRPRDQVVTNGGGGGSDLMDGSDRENRRQLQFATPGGTRVIWVFDSRFQP